MAHPVICSICNSRFDRDKEAYVQTAAKRYAHASCALRQKEKNKNNEEINIIDPANFVECIYCKKTFDKSKEPFKLFSNGKYAHQKCADLESKRELTDQEKLEKYIMQLFNTDYVYARIQKQIKEYTTNYGYTYSGIHKALIYYYEVKGNQFDILKTNGGIGIVPHVYDQAYRYYYAIWEAQQKQEYIVDASSLDEYIPKQIEIKIPRPQRVEKKRKLFSFLDDTEEIE